MSVGIGTWRWRGSGSAAAAGVVAGRRRRWVVGGPTRSVWVWSGGGGGGGVVGCAGFEREDLKVLGVLGKMMMMWSRC